MTAIVNGRRIISREWLARMKTPCALAPYYGYLVWLNHERRVFPSVPASSYFAIGAGSSFTWIEPERQDGGGGPLAEFRSRR